MNSHNKFIELLGEQKCVTAKDELAAYRGDWCQQFKGEPSICLLPTSTDDVVKIMKFCAHHRIDVIPVGGRTGLSGGAAPINGEVVLSLERINAISDFCSIQKKVKVGAGVINTELQQYCQQFGLMWPIHLASSGSCQIGGNLATNAGGMHVIRYGHARRWCLGLTFVDGQGELHQHGHQLIKDNSGYDYCQLLIGSEGTLGVITEATLKLIEAPKQLLTIWFAIETVEQGLSILTTASQLNGFAVHACEFLSHSCLEIQNKTCPSKVAPFYLILSLEPEGNIDSQEKLMPLIETVCYIDAVMPTSTKQQQSLWAFREEITATLAPLGEVFKTDVSVPIETMPQYMTTLPKLAREHVHAAKLFLFGHLGDGNVHVNLVFDKKVKGDIDLQKRNFSDKHGQFIKSLKGSLSAEHGIGLLKKPVMKYMHTPEELALMRRLKSVYDPFSILNPNKMLDS